MKVQWQAQCLRLRLDEAELAQLQAGQGVENYTQLPGAQAHCMQVHKVDAAAAALVAIPDGWRVDLPALPLQAYVARLPCRDGLVFTLPVAAAAALTVEFEVDVRDSVRQRGPFKRKAVDTEE